IEFAVRANSPVLVVAHEGTEKMSTPFEFADNHMKLLKWLPTRHFAILSRTKILNYPHFFETNIDRIKLYYKLYHPKLTVNDLSDDEQTLREQLTVESDAVHALMSSMKAELIQANSKAKKAAH